MTTSYQETSRDQSASEPAEAFDPVFESPDGPPPSDRRPRRRGDRWLVVCLLLGVVLGALVMLAVFTKWVIPYKVVQPMLQKMQEAAAQPPQRVLVSVDEVQRQQVAQKRLVTGMIQPVRASTIASEESGRVMLAPPDMGTVVHKGDVIAKLDTTLMQKQLDVAKADLAEAQAALTEQQATLDQVNNLRKRYEDLAKTGGVSQTELDQAVRDQQVAVARIATAKAAITARQADVAQINERLGKMQVHAPFDGTITEKMTEVGQWLSPGSSVAQIADWAVVDARIEIPESIIDAIGGKDLLNGNEPAADSPMVTLDVPSLGKQVTGKLYRVVPAGDPMARTYPALVRIDNSSGLLRPGMTLTASLATAQQVDALTVPRDAVQTTPTGTRVIADRQGTAAVVPVIVLFTNGDRFVVRGELQPGELVVTEGNERLSAGAPLKIVGKFADRNPQPPEDKKQTDDDAGKTAEPQSGGDN